MIRRTTWIILAVFIVLMGLTIYLSRSGRLTAEQTPPTVEKKVLVPVTVDLIDKVRIEAATGGSITLLRDLSEKWTLADVTTGTPDTVVIEQAINQLTAMTVMTSLEAGFAPELIGLNTPAFTITFSLRDGRTTIVKVGQLTAIGNGYYVQVDQGLVQVVNKYTMDTITGMVSAPPILITPTITATAVVTQTTQTATPMVILTPTLSLTPTQTVTSTLDSTPQLQSTPVQPTETTKP